MLICKSFKLETPWIFEDRPEKRARVPGSSNLSRFLRFSRILGFSSIQIFLSTIKFLESQIRGSFLGILGSSDTRFSSLGTLLRPARIVGSRDREPKGCGHQDQELDRSNRTDQIRLERTLEFSLLSRMAAARFGSLISFRI